MSILQLIILLFIMLILLVAYFLYKCQLQNTFLIYNIKDNNNLRNLFKCTSLILVLVAILSLIILFSFDKYYNLITLFLASVVLVLFSLMLNILK